MKRVLYWVIQWTWGLPQTLIGALICLRYRKRERFSYQDAVVTIWPRQKSSMSLGMFLFLRDGWTPVEHELLAHEYGHTIQSLLLGPLYLLVVGLPSILWAGFGPIVRARKQRKLPYSWLYCEKWADRCGTRFAGHRAIEQRRQQTE